MKHKKSKKKKQDSLANDKNHINIKRAEQPWFDAHVQLLDRLWDLIGSAWKILQATDAHLPQVMIMTDSGDVLYLTVTDLSENAMRVFNDILVRQDRAYAVFLITESKIGYSFDETTDNVSINEKNAEYYKFVTSNKVDALTFCLQCRDRTEIAWSYFIDEDDKGNPKQPELYRMPMKTLHQLRLDLKWPRTNSET